MPHYSQALRGLDVDALTWDAFRALLLLTPKNLQVEFESLKSVAVPPGHGGIAEGKTSGSTGIPVHFLVTEVTQSFWNALAVREHPWHARDFSGKLAAIRVKVEEGYWRDWGSPVAKLFRTGRLATLNVRTGVAPISQIRLIQRTLHRIDAIYTAERPLTSGEHLGMVPAIQESLGYPFEVELIAVDEMPDPERTSIIIDNTFVAEDAG